VKLLFSILGEMLLFSVQTKASKHDYLFAGLRGWVCCSRLVAAAALEVQGESSQGEAKRIAAGSSAQNQQRNA
jgi:hypothetical protein